MTLIPLETIETKTEIGTLSATGWVADDAMTYEQWEAIGATLQAIDGSINWWVGDWLNFGEQKYGEMYAQAINATGWAIQRLKDAKWVAAAIQRSLRQEQLSWTHHRHVAHLPEDKQRHFLQEAVNHSWSTAELKKQINITQTQHGTTHKEMRGTPVDILQDAHSLMEIDLDPASSHAFNKNVRATVFYTPADDGLIKPWFGRVWLHPPTGLRDGYDHQGLWVNRMLASWKAEMFSEGLLLVEAQTGADWFASLWEYPICFIGYRLKFISEDAEISDAPHYMCITYFGENISDFAGIFSKHGAVVHRFA
jgi:hypothetical protein